MPTIFQRRLPGKTCLLIPAIKLLIRFPGRAGWGDGDINHKRLPGKFTPKGEFQVSSGNCAGTHVMTSSTNTTVQYAVASNPAVAQERTCSIRMYGRSTRLCIKMTRVVLRRVLQPPRTFRHPSTDIPTTARGRPFAKLGPPVSLALPIGGRREFPGPASLHH